MEAVLSARAVKSLVDTEEMEHLLKTKRSIERFALERHLMDGA